MQIRPDQRTIDAAEALRVQPGFKQVLDFLGECSKEADAKAIYRTELNDVHRGRAQAYREIVAFLTKPSL
jgi:hypothetical protein